MKHKPYFEKPPVDVNRPRLLLLSHHFPPGTAVGALRWRRMAPHLAAAGWDLDVITTLDATPASLDADIASELPAGIRIWGVSNPEAAFHWPERFAGRIFGRRRQAHAMASAGARLVRDTGKTSDDLSWSLLSPRTYLRLYFTMREVTKGLTWGRRIVGVGLQVIAATRATNGVHAAIISSGPPHSWHDAARTLAVKTGLPFVMDLRDPWSTAAVVHEYFATPAWTGISARQERRAVAQASVIVANTQPLRAAMAAAFPAASARMLTVMNGVDDEPVPGSGKSSTCFRLGYAGSIYLGRDPGPLFAGLARAVAELHLTPSDIEICLTGDVARYGGVDTMAIAREHGVESFVHLTGKVNRAAALEFMASCHVLVSLPWEDTLSIPAKLFEYMRFEAWILAFAMPDGALEQALGGVDADVVSSADVTGVTRAIIRRYRQFRAGERPPLLGDLERFSRRAQAARLIDALRRCTAADTTGGGQPVAR